MNLLDMTDRFNLDSCVVGHYVYKEVWRTVIEETLKTKPEFGNPHDPYAVAVVTSDDTIGNTLH